MIKLSETTEGISNSESIENNIEHSPADIKASEEIDTFWENEFQKAHNEAEFDIYDRLLSDVFDCSEDDINLRFEITEDISTALEKFNAMKWNGKDYSEMREAISDLVKAIGEGLGLKELPEIRITDSGNQFGSYNYESNTITLNQRYFTDPKELIDTISHELRHAYQHMKAEHPETLEDMMYRVNFDNYISPLELPAGGYLFFTDYYNQYVEVDARAFANRITEALR
ncbi:MAG: hypothetical protein IKH78_04660 [Ruminococcus sp.]|nr:hypothetical protein [Ruminococcus sp.]